MTLLVPSGQQAPVDPLTRIADALDRLAPPPPAPPPADLPAYVWVNGVLQPATFRPLALDLLSGIDAQKAALLANTRHLAQGFAAHDILLWGARGSGKSALVKAAVGAVQAEGLPLALVEVANNDPAALPPLFAQLARLDRPTLVFLDDLGFDDLSAARALRPVLDGGAGARPLHVRLAVTANRRHLVARAHGSGDAMNARDVLDDELALADRFGLSLGFHPVDQDNWLAMVEGYARAHALPFDPADALRFAAARGARSGRVAWHYTVEVAGRAGRSLA